MLRSVEEGIGAVTVPMSATTMDDLETTWAEVYKHARPTLLRALAASIGSFEGVEDAVQEAVADAISQQKTDVRSPEGWLYAVALNKLRGHRRRAAVFARLRLERPAPADELDDALLRIDVSRRLLALPQRDRELLVAKYYVGMTQDDIAKLMRMPRGTVASSIARAAAKYRAMERRR
jgi:RNA polymerase sigma factor (sigma-70 family)